MRFSTIVSLLSLVALPFVEAHSNRHSRHSDVAKRGSSLSKRAFNGQFTFFNDGQGACGKVSKPSDFIVALNSDQYDGGKYCGETITITYNGKSTQAVIMDECPGCGMYGLDFSTGLFQFFASESVGVLEGSWSFGSGGGGDSTSVEPTHTSTTHTSTKPTTTWTPTTTSTHSSTHHTTSTQRTTSTHHTTSSYSHTSSSTPTSTKTSTSTSSTPSSTAIDYNTGIAAGLAQATGSLSQGVTSGLNDLNQAFVGLAALLVAASDA